jgi:outer membrane immunogenic protein
MRHLSTVLLAAFALSIGGIPRAGAADMPVKAQPSVTAATWTGFYVGANVGYGWGNTAVQIAGTPPFDAFVGPAIDSTTATDPKGVLGGIQAGYNFQYDAIVLGIETDLDWSGIRKNQTDAHGDPGLPATLFTTSGDQKLDLFGTLRGRLGWTFVNLLIYATGGLAYGHASVSTTTGSTIGGVFCSPGGFSDCTSGSASKTLAGSAWGGGLEWNLGGHWSAKAEYLYYNLGGLSFSAPNALNPVNPFRSSVDFKGNIGRIGLNYKLSGM